jgi:predicted  nucleic acid-binding Zn-ribbon protein
MFINFNGTNILPSPKITKFRLAQKSDSEKCNKGYNDFLKKFNGMEKEKGENIRSALLWKRFVEKRTQDDNMGMYTASDRQKGLSNVDLYKSKAQQRIKEITDAIDKTVLNDCGSGRWLSEAQKKYIQELRARLSGENSALSFTVFAIQQRLHDLKMTSKKWEENMIQAVSRFAPAEKDANNQPNPALEGFVRIVTFFFPFFNSSNAH